VGFYDSKNALGITDKETLEQVEKIRELRYQGVSDEQIMQQLKLSHGAYWRRVKKMKEMDREVMMQKFTDDVSSDVRMFETRIQRDIMACEFIISNQHEDATKRLDAIRLKTDLGIIMVRMFREGRSIINIDKLKQREERFLR
jgi:hypothetical protein